MYAPTHMHLCTLTRLWHATGQIEGFHLGTSIHKLTVDYDPNPNEGLRERAGIGLQPVAQYHSLSE